MSITIAQFKDGSIETFVVWDWCNANKKVLREPWTGKTVFRIAGPNEMDYGVESREIRNALTDFKYAGDGQQGMNDIYLVGAGASEMVLLEDDQATIRILESGRSRPFRHTDKTQRLILAWLAEQFGRRHFVLVYVASILQAADIFTKPLSNAEEWDKLIKLLAIVSSPEPPILKAEKSLQSKGEPSAVVASSGPQGILIEVCCRPNSKLGDTQGCIVIRITEQDDITFPKTRKRVIDQVNDVLRKHGPVMAKGQQTHTLCCRQD